jgi:S1-C subfamily serine protease
MGVTALAVVMLLAVGQAGAENVGKKSQNGGVSGQGHGAARASGQHAPGYLGIGFQDLNEEQATALHLKLGNGVMVTKVDQDGPAGKAGLRPLDVIVSLNGQLLTGADGLHKMIRESGPGTEIALMVLRGGQSVAVTAQLKLRGDVERAAIERIGSTDLAPSSEADAAADAIADPAPASGTVDARGPGFIASMLHMTPFTGVAMETMEPQLAGFFGAPAGVGLLVHTVMPNSPAAAAGLHAGDVVIRADAVAMKTTSEWTKRLHASKGAPITLNVIRDKHEITLTIIPDLKKHAEVEWPRFFQ